MKRKHPKRHAIIRTMTNWQRTQWARAGYPGSGRPQHGGAITDLKTFAALVRQR